MGLFFTDSVILTHIATKGFTNGFPKTSDWNSMEQFKDFWLFIKGMESWYTFPRYTWQGRWYHTAGVSAQFLGSHQTKKAQAMKPLWCNHRGVRGIRRVPSSMEFLHSSTDHPVSQWCRIYQLEEIRIKAGELPDELVERIWELANRCNIHHRHREGKTLPVPDGMCPQRHRPDQEAIGYENWSDYWDAGYVPHTHSNCR